MRFFPPIRAIPFLPWPAAPSLPGKLPGRRGNGARLGLLALAALLLCGWPSPAARAQAKPEGSEPSGPTLEVEGGETVVRPGEEAERPLPMPSDRFRPGARTLIAREKFSDTQQTVADVLEEVPGVAVTRSGDAMSPTQVRIRGARADQVLIVVDGVTVQGGGDDPAARRRENRSGFDLAALPLSQVESIEVVRGAASGLYGPGAAAGAVIIHTRRALEPSGEVAATLGSGGYREGDTQWNWVRRRTDGTDDRFTLRLNRRESEGRYVFYDAEAAQASTATPADSPCAVPLGGGYFERRCNESRFTTVQTEWRHDALHLGLSLEDTLRLGLLGVEQPLPHGRETGRRVRVQIEDRWEPAGAPGGGPGAGALLWNGWAERYAVERYANTTDPASEPSRFRDDRVALDGAWEQWLANHKLTAGLGAQRQVLNDLRFRAERTTLSTRGAWRLHRETGVWEAALRRDDLSDLEAETTGRGALAETLWRDLGIKASLGTGYRPPSLYELYDPGALPGSAAGTAANPALQPERSRSGDGGLFLDWSDRFYLEIIAFRHDAENTIIAVPVAAAPSLLRFENVRRTRSTGLEGTLNARWAPGWSLDLAWTRTDAVIEDNGGGDPREIGNQVPGIPRKRYTLAAAWRRAGRHLWLQARYQGERFIDSANTRYLQPYTLVDAGLTWPLAAAWELSLTGRNLTNITYAEIDNFPPPGRQGFLTLRWKQGGGVPDSEAPGAP